MLPMHLQTVGGLKQQLPDIPQMHIIDVLLGHPSVHEHDVWGCISPALLLLTGRSHGGA